MPLACTLQRTARTRTPVARDRRECLQVFASALGGGVGKLGHASMSHGDAFHFHPQRALRVVRQEIYARAARR